MTTHDAGASMAAAPTSTRPETVKPARASRRAARATRAPKPDAGGENKRHKVKEVLSALPWTVPALILIFAVVLFPAGYMIYNSTRDISVAGVDHGSVGWANYKTLFANPALVRVLINTVIWVVAVVLLTIVISLVLAHFLNKQFPGRQFVRLAVIVPWASSVIMTTTVIYYGLQPNYGIIQQFVSQFLNATHLAQLFCMGQATPDVGYTAEAIPALTIAILVAVFVSLPFTTYTLLAGTQSISKDVIEAARVDGANGRRAYFSVILPQLKPALAVATIINIINVFNSLPILQTITGSIPGNDADTTTTLIFKYIRSTRQVDVASALSVVNFGIVILVIVAYMWIVKPMKGVDE